MEHLFRIKKDGKCVGYCHWTEDWGWKYFNDLIPENEYTHFIAAPTGLTAHPFVCEDKNGKKVFGGDKIKFKTPAMLRETKGIVVWYKNLMGWITKEIEKDENWSLYAVYDIELIEDESK